jgi:hypothetical protein
VRQVEYRVVLKPRIEVLEQGGILMLDAKGMAEFLGVEANKVHQPVYTDRIPLPGRLGIGKTCRWSVLELLAWVAAGCPRRTQWIKMRGSSGWYPQWRW